MLMRWLNANKIFSFDQIIFLGNLNKILKILLYIAFSFPFHIMTRHFSIVIVWSYSEGHIKFTTISKTLYSFKITDTT